MDLLLQFEGGLDGSEGGSPFVGPGLGNVLEDDTPAPPVLVVDELLGVLAFLIRVLAKALGEAVQCNVIAIKVSSLKEKKNPSCRDALSREITCTIFFPKFKVLPWTCIRSWHGAPC